jgi:hypothetical protein
LLEPPSGAPREGRQGDAPGKAFCNALADLDRVADRLSLVELVIESAPDLRPGGSYRPAAGLLDLLADCRQTVARAREALARG